MLTEQPRGHLQFEGTDVEVVAYRSGERLALIVNKKGVCVYRCTLTNAFSDIEPSTMPALDPKEDTFIIRSING